MIKPMYCILLGIVYSLSSGAVLAAQEITVCGTGDSQVLLRELARAFERGHPGTAVHVPDSIGSSGGIKMTARGKCDLGRTARPIRQNEKEYNLHYKVFALSAVVFAVNSSVNDVETLSSDQITGIYSGDIRRWGELGSGRNKIYVVNREEGDSSRTVLEEKLDGFGDIENFAGKTLYSTPRAVGAVLKYKDTIGYVPLGAVAGRSGLNVLKIDGIFPSAENVKSGAYRFVSSFGVVWKGELRGLSKDFVEFLSSPQAKKIISEKGTIPAE